MRSVLSRLMAAWMALLRSAVSSKVWWTRFSSILARLASPYNGERAAAELLASASVAKHGLRSRDKVGDRNEICEVARCEPLANQGIRSAVIEYIPPFHDTPQREECDIVNVLGACCVTGAKPRG